MSSAQVGVVTGSDIPGPNLALLASMPRVDLMPPEVAEGEALKRLKLGCLASLLACCAAVGGVWVQAHSTIGTARKNVATAEGDRTKVTRQVALLSTVAAQFAAADQGKQLIQQALGGEVRWSTQLRDLSMTIPNNVWLTTMIIAPGGSSSAGTSATSTASSPATGASTPAGSANVATITFSGTASSRYDVARWLDSLSGMTGYVGATYSTSTERVIGSQTYVDFNSTVQLTSAVLSGRYTSTSGS